MGEGSRIHWPLAPTIMKRDKKGRPVPLLLLGEPPDKKLSDDELKSRVSPYWKEAAKNAQEKVILPTTFSSQEDGV